MSDGAFSCWCCPSIKLNCLLSLAICAWTWACIDIVNTQVFLIRQEEGIQHNQNMQCSRIKISYNLEEDKHYWCSYELFRVLALELLQSNPSLKHQILAIMCNLCIYCYNLPKQLNIRKFENVVNHDKTYLAYRATKFRDPLVAWI